MPNNVEPREPRLVTDRRTMLCGVAVLGAGVALAGCASPSASVKSAPAGTTLGNASDVPVGSGKIFAREKVVVTQPTAGTFKAFSAICTHQGCMVSSIQKDQIHCNCHGSVFSVDDGSVISGPAPSPLPAQTVTDQGGTLKLA